MEESSRPTRTPKPNARLAELEPDHGDSEAPRTKRTRKANAKAKDKEGEEEEEREAPELAPEKDDSVRAKGKAKGKGKRDSDKKENLCKWRQAEQIAHETKEVAELVVTDTLELKTGELSVTLHAGDKVKRFCGIKAEQKKDVTVFRLQRGKAAVNWNVFGRLSGTEGEMLHFPVADVIEIDNQVPEDTADERVRVLAEEDRKILKKIAQSKIDMQAFSKAKKKAKTSAAVALRPPALPTITVAFPDLGFWRTTFEKEVAPLIEQLGRAVTVFEAKSVVFDQAATQLQHEAKRAENTANRVMEIGFQK